MFKKLGSGVSLAEFNPSISSCVTSGMLFKFFPPPSPSLQKKDNNGCFEDLVKIICVKSLGRVPEPRKDLINVLGTMIIISQDNGQTA